MQADLVQVALYAAVLVALAIPLGLYIARVFSGELTFLAPVERAILGAVGGGGQ
jgi:potassium-transporting ATPase potassium-binding subunit